MLKKDFKHIANIIFDIGDVLIDIDYDLMDAEFEKLAHVDFKNIISKSGQTKLFDQFERGELDAQAFRDGLRKYLKEDTTDEQIDAAWNSLIVNYPREKFELLKALKKDYNVLALSNINPIHLDKLNRDAKELLGADLFSDFFHKAYYSHELGCRKPEPDIYEWVLNEEGIVPEETLFIDDKADNVKEANIYGIKGMQLKEREKLIPQFFDFPSK
jgi:FMN phosphatase YigB (HAD superfamily)